MKNVSNVVKKSQSILCEDHSTWIPLYYSFEKDSVYTTSANDRFLVTTLINPNTSKDIIEAVERWKRL